MLARHYENSLIATNQGVDRLKELRNRVSYVRICQFVVPRRMTGLSDFKRNSRV